MTRVLSAAAAVCAIAAVCALGARVAGPDAFAGGAHQADGAGLRSSADDSPARLWDAGRPTLVVFGYAGCGDACPFTLARLSRLAGTFARAASPRVVFVDVNAADGAPAVEAYVRRFGAVSGVHGDVRAVQAAERSVGAAVTADAARHDTRVFVLDEAGVVVGALPPDADDAALRDRLRALFRPDGSRRAKGRPLRARVREHEMHELQRGACCDDVAALRTGRQRTVEEDVEPFGDILRIAEPGLGRAIAEPLPPCEQAAFDQPPRRMRAFRQLRRVEDVRAAAVRRVAQKRFERLERADEPGDGIAVLRKAHERRTAQGRCDELVLRAEVPVQRAFRHLGRRRDAIDADRVDAVLVEEAGGDLGDVVAKRLARGTA